MKRYKLFEVSYTKDDIYFTDYIKADTLRDALNKFEEWSLTQNSKVIIKQLLETLKTTLIDE
jgi:hypothetical protein